MGISGGTVGKNPPTNTADTRDAGSTPRLGRSPGKGNGNPLQYSCPGNPMDGGAWRATVHGVTKSWTRLSNWHICTLSDIQSEITSQAKSQGKNTTHNEKSLFSDIWRNMTKVHILWHFSFACSDTVSCPVGRPTWQRVEGASVQWPSVHWILPTFTEVRL